MSDKTDAIQSNGGAADASAPTTESGVTDVSKSEPAKAGGDPLAEARAEAQKNREQWVRTAADFDNYRKRSRREVEDARKAGREDLLKDFLPVFDNLERALQSSQRATEVKGVVDGLGMIMKQFGDTLGRSGIQKVPTKGALFDPTMHEAIQQVESDEPPGTVVAEVQAGYLQGERLVRAALVVVAQPRAGAPAPAEAATPAASAEKKEAAGEGGKDEAKPVETEEGGPAKAT